jgi:hypothetical protein
MVRKTTEHSTIFRGHFTAEMRGHFAAEWWGHLRAELVGHYPRILHLIRHIYKYPLPLGVRASFLIDTSNLQLLQMMIR